MKFNQSAYNIDKRNEMMQPLLFLVLSSPSSFSETVTVQLIINNTDNSENGMIRKYAMCDEYSTYYVL